MRAAIARVQAKVHARNNGVGPADAAGVGQADDPGVGQAGGPGSVGLIRARTGRQGGRVNAAETAEERIEAGRQYRKDLLTRFASGKMHAVDVCATAYLHTRSGGLGAADLALPPGQDGNAMRTIRHALGVETRRRAYINVPQWNSEKARREIRPLEVRFPHEAIAHDFQRNPHLYDKSMVDASEYRLEQYTQHPVTVTHGEADVWPIGYYTDKVALGRNEYFYRGSGGVTFVRKRLTFWIIAGCDICKCGCGGACTIDAVQIEMNHSFNLLQEKIYMPCRRDGLQWLRSDSWRRTVVAEQLPLRGAVCEYRGDWPERAAQAGMKGHGAFAGCMCCTATSADLHTKYDECTLFHLPWPKREHSNLMRELQLQLIKVTINSLDEKILLLDSLRWLSKYPWGCRIKPRRGQQFGLKTNDKLCVGGDLGSDLHSLSALPVPFEIFFFRTSKRTPFTGVSLLWDVDGVHAFGIKHFQVGYFVDCILHTVDLGVAQRACGHSMLCLLRNNVFNLRNDTLLGRMQAGALHMRRALRKHYRAFAKSKPNALRVSRLQAFTLHKLGSLQRPCLKAKGAQSRAAVWFCRDMLRKHAAVCGQEGELLQEACNSLCAYYDLLKKEPRKMTLRAKLHLFGQCVSHVQAYKAAGGHLVAKHHGFIHLTRSILTSGNPRFTSTYEDEHENGVCASICKIVHRSTMVRSAFERLEVLEKLD